MTAERCTWTEGGIGEWESGCGESFIFTDGGPGHNGFAWCPYCGKPLAVDDANDNPDPEPPKPLPARIRVTGASGSGFWYADRIGEEFAVTGKHGWGYVVDVPDARHGRTHYVSPSDCEAVP